VAVFLVPSPFKGGKVVESHRTQLHLQFEKSRELIQRRYHKPWPPGNEEEFRRRISRDRKRFLILGDEDLAPSGEAVIRISTWYWFRKAQIFHHPLKLAALLENFSPTEE